MPSRLLIGSRLQDVLSESLEKRRKSSLPKAFFICVYLRLFADKKTDLG